MLANYPARVKRAAMAGCVRRFWETDLSRPLTQAVLASASGFSGVPSVAYYLDPESLSEKRECNEKI